MSGEPGEAGSHRLCRDGCLDLAFDGWLIGTGGGESGDYGFVTDIYATVSGSFVVHETRKKGGAPDRRSASFHLNHISLLTGLMPRGRFSKSGKAAWDNACENWPPLTPHRYERVD